MGPPPNNSFNATPLRGVAAVRVRTQRCALTQALGLMNYLDVKCEQRQSDDGGSHIDTAFYVDGRPLLEMIREFESSFAGDLAGSYSSNFIDDYTEDFLLGKESNYGENSDKTELLCCVCGCPGCWPLAARISVDDQIVTWDAFEQPHRDWSYDEFGPFVFDLAQYRMAIAKIHA